MRKNKNKFPDFNKMTNEEEAHWWETHNTMDYIDELEEVQVEFYPEALQPPKKLTKGIHVRLDPTTLTQLRTIARKKGLGATTLARMWILESLQVARKAKTATSHK